MNEVEKNHSHNYGYSLRTFSIIVALAFLFYTLLSCKNYTWLFVSGDSGDWLAASLMWFAPQPYGSPLYVFLGKFLALLPGDLVLKETLLLSCLPSAVTIGLVYLIAAKITGTRISSLAAIVLLGAAVFLTQSTVLEQYALSTMLITLAFWFYLGKRRKLCLLSLGLATAVHIFALPIALLWLIIERKDWKYWLKASWVYILFGILPYIYIPILMYLNAPPLIAGWLEWGNLGSLKYYLFEIPNALVGQLSLFDLPKRLAVFVGLLIVSFGIAWLPIILSLRRPIEKHTQIILATIGFSLWYYFFNLDPTTWTFLIFSFPFLAILACVGLTRMRKRYVYTVALGAFVLIFLNSFLLNAHLLSQNTHTATDVKSQIEALPQGSAVASLHGPYILCLFYVMSEGRDDLMPIFFSNIGKEGRLTSWYVDYCEWVFAEYGVCAFDPTEMAQEALESGRQVYVMSDKWRLDEGLGLSRWSNFCLNEITYVDGKGAGLVREIAQVVPAKIPVKEVK